jgi:hypothetical protein
MNDYTKYTSLGRVKLTKNDLSELVALIKSGFPPQKRKEDFKITTTVSYLNISENELENFLKHTDLPMILDNININMIGWSDTGVIDKAVYLRLNRYSNELTVSGHDQTWVLGKNTQLLDYIKVKRPFLSFINKIFTSVIIGVIGGVIASILIEIIRVFLKSGWNSINLLIVISILPLVIIFYSLTKIKNTNIIIRESQSFSDKYGIAITIVLSFLTLIATVAIGIIQIIRK